MNIAPKSSDENIITFRLTAEKISFTIKNNCSKRGQIFHLVQGFTSKIWQVGSEWRQI